MHGRPPTVADRWVAAQRARLERTRPLTPGGDVAGERRFYRDVAGRLTPALGPTGTVALRTRVVDAEVARALGHGTEQVVLVGAAYDGRPLRFGGGPTRWFVADHPGRLADARHRLDALGIAAPGRVDVAVDLGAPREGVGEQGDGALADALGAAAHDPARPTLFVGEDLALAWPLAVTASVCTGLCTRAARGSVLVAGFDVAPEAAGAARAARAARGLLWTT
ncbi:MAG TPA: class I SAM-dependent methyltransferase, partial [Acidimicrobiales bacterium]|nr:class I SAM-dependent methyltransferase [Acidimicrobiales bacterium]